MTIRTGADAREAGGRRLRAGLWSVMAGVAIYTLVSNAYRLFDLSPLPDSLIGLLRPQSLPPTQRLVEAFVQLVGGGHAMHGSGSHADAGGHLGMLLEQNVTLQGSLLISALRVMAGLVVGGSLGVLVGLALGWSRKVDEYVHPVYILLRSIPPLALITYLMLWLGHGEAHVVLPIVYAVFTTVVIPTYHGVRDIAAIYVRAAQTLGARGWLLFSKVVLPAAGPLVLAGVRYALIVAWMTAAGAEMVMGESGIGYLLVGGGIWSARLKVAVDPAVVMVGIVGLAAVGYVMDAAAKVVGERLTSWVRR